MAYRTPSDVGLAQFGHVNGALDARGEVRLFESMLKRQSVDDRAEHAHIVGVGALHPGSGGSGAPEDVPSTHDDGDFYSHRMDFMNFLRYVVNDVMVDPVLEFSSQGFA